ncbi:O-antigen ligase family protein [Microbacterium testaceum]|uniref:O-antigen ligase-related domain-containing protein n=1 Tax=Microbacterium testaceum TaxID=2033 RepID=A0A147FAY3_MICTE|nr:O-antigen ligase family protein [Microbacterium testaceum]KTS13612.1 hypothetical protein RSA3_03900 [Microbacterium testaceum]
MTVIIAVAGMIALAALIRSLVLHRDEWNLSSTFILVAGWLLNLATTLGVFTGGVQVTVDAFYQRATVISGWLATLNEAATAALVGVSLVAIAVGLYRKIPLNGPALGVAAVVMMASLATASTGSLTGALSPRSLALLFLVLACAFLEPGRGALLGAATFGVSVAVASAVAPLVSTAAVSPCGDKCGLFGIVLQGALGNGNGTGLLLALALPAVYLAFTQIDRWALVAFMAFVIASTGSRTSLNATIVVIAVFAVSRPDVASTLVSTWRKALLPVTVTAFALTSAMVPLVNTNPAAFTGRGYLWTTAMSYGADRSLTGSGTQLWQGLYGNGVISQNATYSAHNQWIDVWFISGFAGLAVFVVSVGFAFWRAGSGAHVVAAMALPAMVIAISERPWAIGTIDWLTWALLTFLLAAPLGRPAENFRLHGSLPVGADVKASVHSP